MSTARPSPDANSAPAGGSAAGVLANAPASMALV